MNKLIFAGITINTIITLVFALVETRMSWLVLLLLVANLVSIVGLIAISVDRIRTGAYLVIVGCAPFFPIGIIGMLGAREVLDHLTREEFERHRAQRSPPAYSRPESHMTLTERNSSARLVKAHKPGE